MSADNFISVYETNSGDFLVSMEFASDAWEVEFSFWQLEDKARRWRERPTVPGKYGVFKTMEEALRTVDVLEQSETILEYGTEIVLKEDRIKRVRLAVAHRDGLPLHYLERIIERLALSRRATINS